ncbi:hypothetical protein WJX72_010037 [[Myrmecia] bisecta]|uniref:Protein kinase domain-containing protein n=1 Tax=[Myrmecia] bisecta TaxID=41462 RepID=A0AAW1QGG6_9CHLO
MRTLTHSMRRMRVTQPPLTLAAYSTANLMTQTAPASSTFMGATSMLTGSRGGLIGQANMGQAPIGQAPIGQAPIGQANLSLGQVNRASLPYPVMGARSTMGSNMGSVMSSASTASFDTGKVKIICSSGGTFVKLPTGGYEYQGGETRLISVENFCAFSTLRASLDRVTGCLGCNNSGGSDTQSLPIKYQLPSNPSVYVDLVDDVDVTLMFDEWQEYMSTQKGNASAKLHIYIASSRNSMSGQSSQLTKSHSGGVAAVERTVSGGGHTAEGRATVSGGQASSSGTPRYDLEEIAERMEVISPADVQLVKFLGSGGYGEVYLGKWHSSEAAIKCLNPSLFFGGGGDQASNMAITELIKEADLLGSLRHPNVVWVYGVVLPRVQQDDDLREDDGDAVDMMAQDSRQRAAGTVRPPAIVTEFMSQGSLKGALARKAEIITGNLMRLLVAMDAAKGMEYLHSKRIVHFDLKSANLLLGYRDRRAICKVADFGLSKQKRETYVSGVSSQRGTLPWIAPEIIKTPNAVTEKVDVYSFGIVLYELWTGKEPYEGLNYHALLHQMTTSAVAVRPTIPGTPEWEGEPLPELAEGYRNLMERCWAESPHARPSFAEIVQELKAMANTLRPQRRPRPAPGAAGVVAGTTNLPKAASEGTAPASSPVVQPPSPLSHPL